MSKQKGVTLFGMMVVSLVVIGLAIVGMKVTPAVIEYFTILKNIKAIASNVSPGASVAEIRRAFVAKMMIDEISSVTPEDLDISKDGNDIVIAFEYAKKIPLAGNVSLCIDFAGSTSGAKRARVD